jgi:hypothetical protein
MEFFLSRIGSLVQVRSEVAILQAIAYLSRTEQCYGRHHNKDLMRTGALALSRNR